MAHFGQWSLLFVAHILQQKQFTPLLLYNLLQDAQLLHRNHAVLCYLKNLFSSTRRLLKMFVWYFVSVIIKLHATKLVIHFQQQLVTVTLSHDVAKSCCLKNVTGEMLSFLGTKIPLNIRTQQLYILQTIFRHGHLEQLKLPPWAWMLVNHCC